MGDWATAGWARFPRSLTGAVGAVIVMMLLISACSRGPNSDEPGGASGGTDDTGINSEIVAAPENAGTVAGAEITESAEPLVLTRTTDEVYCDGTNREVGTISGAMPGELLLFSSPVPTKLNSAAADDTGSYTLLWNCEPNEARLQWELTAVGHDSGRMVTFNVAGTAIDPASELDLVVTLISESVTCDGFTHRIGTVSAADPSEPVQFSSPESSDIRPGQADGRGELDLNWVCDPGDVGRTWNVTATGANSAKTGSFMITGVAPEPTAVEPLEVTVTEEPFICDGETRQFATISNYAPLEVVDFTSPEASALIDGRADGGGAINLRWQCGLSDVGKTWNLTALGVTSQRTTTLTITGAAPSESTTELVVAFTENPFGCDGTSRVFAEITNFVPGEYVDFSSPQSGPLRQGQADAGGKLPVRWQCGAGDIEKLWDITATGATSGKTTTFRVTGAEPPSE